MSVALTSGSASAVFLIFCEIYCVEFPEGFLRIMNVRNEVFSLFIFGLAGKTGVDADFCCVYFF